MKHTAILSLVVLFLTCSQFLYSQDLAAKIPGSSGGYPIEINFDRVKDEISVTKAYDYNLSNVDVAVFYKTDAGYWDVCYFENIQDRKWYTFRPLVKFSRKVVVYYRNVGTKLKFPSVSDITKWEAQCGYCIYN